MSWGLGFRAMIVPGGAFLPPSSRVLCFSVEGWFWMKLIAALMCTVVGTDHNPTGGGQLPYPNECNSMLMSTTRRIYPFPYIQVLMNGNHLRSR